MKTSFYFVIWIILCWFLLLSRINFIQDHTLLIATTIVVCAYRIINTRSLLQTLVWFEGILSLRNKAYLENPMPANKKGKCILRLFLVVYSLTLAIYIAYYITWYLVRHHIEEQLWCYTVWEALAIFIIIVCWIIVTPNHDSIQDNPLGEENLKEYKRDVAHFTPNLFKLFQRVNMFFLYFR